LLWFFILSMLYITSLAQLLGDRFCSCMKLIPPYATRCTCTLFKPSPPLYSSC
jgi:hypothetical protein